jgi:hypothetical protein
MLTRKLLNQGFLLAKSKSSPQTFYVRHHDLVDRYGISVSQMTTDMFHFFNAEAIKNGQSRERGKRSLKIPKG